MTEPLTAAQIVKMIHPDLPPATAHFLLNEAKPLLVELEQLQAQGGSQHKGANMIDNNELISTLRERAALYAYGSADSMACTAAASLLEAQACEIERHDIEYSVRGLLLLDTERERDQLRAELAALQCEDELPTPDGYLFSRPGISKIDVSPHGGDWERLYSEAKLRQAQSMVRAKMVPLTAEQIIDAIYKADAQHDIEFMTAEWPVIFTRVIELAHGITGEPK